MSNKFSIEIVEAPNPTLIELFVMEIGKFIDTSEIPDSLIERFIKMEHNEIEQAELDAKEIVIIKELATQSTSEASKYAEGYKEGYQRALDYITDTIKNKIEIKENANNEFRKGTANTTHTTFLCTEFVSDQLFYKGTLPHCMRCGKPQYQHPIISHTI
jgi:hypothetical protein